jgi:hypothetical protein
MPNPGTKSALALLLAIGACATQTDPLFSGAGDDEPGDPGSARYQVGADTVVDRATGLEWQRAPGALIDTGDRASRDAAAGACAALRLGGNADWRLPSSDELRSLAVLGRSPAISEPRFPETAHERFMSARAFQSQKTDAVQIWIVAFGPDYTNHELAGWLALEVAALEPPQDAAAASWNTRARCVRAAEHPERFRPAVGLLFDATTELTWQKAPPPYELSSDEADQYCATLALDGARSFHVPTLEQLESLYVDQPGIAGESPGIAPTAALAPLPAGWFWSSSSLRFGERTSDDVDSKHDRYAVAFTTAAVALPPVASLDRRIARARVRCVK